MIDIWIVVAKTVENKSTGDWNKNAEVGVKLFNVYEKILFSRCVNFSKCPHQILIDWKSFPTFHVIGD